MLKRSLLTATLGAGALALSLGGAFAQSGTSSDPSSRSGSSGSATSPSTGAGSSTMGQSGSGSSESSSPSAAAAKPSMPSQALVGKEIVNTKGDKIGEIEEVAGEKVIVSVGGFLGMGDRKVAVDWDKVNMQGAGEDARLQTSLTKEELEAMPEYKEGSGSGSGSTSAPSTGGSSSGTTSSPSR